MYASMLNLLTKALRSFSRIRINDFSHSWLFDPQFLLRLKKRKEKRRSDRRGFYKRETFKRQVMGEKHREGQVEHSGDPSCRSEEEKEKKKRC